MTKVEETWWHQIAQASGNTLLRNDSWSGSTVCTTGYDGADTSATSAFVYRLDKLINNNYFAKNDVDTVFVFGGTNDTWANSPVGEIKYDNITAEDLKSALPAMSYMIKRIKDVSPDTEVICILNTALSGAIRDGYKEICKHYGVSYVQLNALSVISGHPTVDGMIQIKNSIYSDAR